MTGSRRKSFRHIHRKTTERGRQIDITQWNNDEWNGFADLLANLIEKYAAVLDIDNLPEPSVYIAKASVGTCQRHVQEVEAKNNKVHETEKNFTDSCIDDKKSTCYN